MNVQMPGDERQMWGNWSPKRCWAHPTEKVGMSKSKAKMLEREPKEENEESRKNEKKERWIEG